MSASPRGSAAFVNRFTKEESMRFLSSLPDPVYVAIPKVEVFEHGRRRVERGLRAEFGGHLFDSEVAQRRYRWTDEERQIVERTLMEHDDFGRPVTSTEGRKPRLYLADGPLPEHMTVHSPDAAPPPPESPRTARCTYTIATEDGAEQCKRPANAGGLYCTQHDRKLAAAATG